MAELRTGSALLMEATHRMAAVGVPSASRDARRLLAHTLEISAARVSLMASELIPLDKEVAFEGLVERRCAREPVSHLTGSREFYGRRFDITRDVLDPRPETETLIEAALAAPFGHVLDIGTGSGCILLTLLAERDQATGQGCDISPSAISVAERNKQLLAIGKRADFILSDWLAQITGTFDLIVSNPPYIAQHEMAGLAPEVRDWEPRLALTDEADGLSAYHIILSHAPEHLQKGGRLMVEIGAAQGASVASLFEQGGFKQIRIIKDLDGRDRVVTGLWP